MTTSDQTEALHGDALPYIEDYDMTLSLTPVEARPIKLPVYRNERIRSFGLWFADNQNSLSDYFNALNEFVPEGTEPLADFFEFAATAREREELKLLMARVPHGGSL